MSRPTIERVEGTVMAVNSYLVHGPDGVIVVDGQLTITDARAVRQRIAAIGKPVAALVVTHGHPDTELFVGHGPPAGIDALAAQRRYVEAFVEAVDGGRELDPDARHDAVVARMRQLLPTDDLAFLMELSIEPALAGLP
jgi:glyoxylase-like metal-dependent hydrolase (beta-lactamase superfamily II)